MDKAQIVSFLEENPDYIDELEKIVEYEIEADKTPDNPWIEDKDFDVCWESTDVGVHPSTLYQIELQGIIERVADTNSTTKYSLNDRAGARSALSEVDLNEDGVNKSIHDFPSEEDLDGDLFNEVIGYDEIKWLLKRGLTTEKITNFLFVGPPGSAKSVFLLAIRNKLENAQYVMASEASSSGVMDLMFEESPKYMLVDEFDDMDNEHQSAFASYTETGILKETKHNKTREMETNTKTLAAANDKSKIKDNILDRFTVLEFDSYDYHEFVEVCKHVLPMEEGKSEEESEMIADAVWSHSGEGDVRQAIQIARLSRGDPEKVISVLDEYSPEDDSLYSRV